MTCYTSCSMVAGEFTYGPNTRFSVLKEGTVGRSGGKGWCDVAVHLAAHMILSGTSATDITVIIDRGLAKARECYVEKSNTSCY